MNTPSSNRIRDLLLIAVSLLLQPVFAQDGTWSYQTPMPTARYAPAAGVINGKLFVVSGAVKSNSPPYTRFTVVEAYDPVTNSWSTNYAPIPLGVNASASGVINGKLYVAGGQTGWELAGPPGNVTNLQVYDPVANIWSNAVPMPFASSSVCGGVINGQLYVAGGTTPDNYSVTNALRVYDPVANAWSRKAPMPVALAWAGAGSSMESFMWSAATIIPRW